MNVTAIDQEVKHGIRESGGIDGVTKSGSKRCGGRSANTADPTRVRRDGDHGPARPGGREVAAIVFFETEDDYRKGDAALDAMPTGDTPGSRASITKYDVAIRLQA